MRFKEMPPEEITKALEGQRDILTPLIQADEEIYQAAPCPWCRSNAVHRAFDVKLYLANNRPIPRYNLRCADCNCLFSPFTGIVLEIGNIARARITQNE